MRAVFCGGPRLNGPALGESLDRRRKPTTSQAGMSGEARALPCGECRMGGLPVGDHRMGLVWLPGWQWGVRVRQGRTYSEGGFAECGP